MSSEIDKLSKLKISKNESPCKDIKSIGWIYKINGSPHLGHFSGIMKVSKLACAPETRIRILLDDSDYEIKINTSRIDEHCLIVSDILKNIFKKLGLENVEFFRSSELRNSESFVNDFYKLISVTGENEALEVLEKQEDVKMADLLKPVIKILDSVLLNVDIVVHDNIGVYELGNRILPLIKYKELSNIDNNIIFNSKNEKMSHHDKSLSINVFDTEKNIEKKINKFFCEEGNLNCNILGIFENVIFPYYSRIEFEVRIVTKSEEVLNFEKYSELERIFLDKKCHPGDLKKGCVRLICEMFRSCVDENERRSI
ncbi:hypothetical protein P3W45_001810 [Vairimorpha bombi]